MSYWTKRRRINMEVDKLISDLKGASGFDCDDGELGEGSFSLPDSFNVPTNDTVSGDLENVGLLGQVSRPTVGNSACNLSNNSATAGVVEFADETEDIDDMCNLLSDSDSYHETCSDIVSEIRGWYLRHPITVNAFADLLAVLQPHFKSLPKDPRTILHTATAGEIDPLIEHVSNGQYYHFGVSSGITCQLNNYFELLKISPAVSLQINIDGVPLFKSTNGQFWPILGRIDSPFMGKPFVIGLFYGECKPKNLDFLKKFASECCELTTHGLQHDNLKLNFSVSAVICDAPARAMIKSVKGHNSYSGCERCVQTGEWKNKMTYPLTEAPKRTDLAFDEMADVEHHNGKSPLSDIGIGMVSQVVLDYMHLICLGVVRRLVWFWMSGPVALNCRLRANCIMSISDALIKIKPYIPVEFARKPRPISEYQRWKATEFRTFLLYTGPVALFGKLSESVYANFTLLSVGMYILLDQRHVVGLVDYAEQLLALFVRHYADLYGHDMVVYNVHNVLHIADDARKYGSLDRISAFPFENYLGKLVKLVHKPSKPLVQVIHRILEQKHEHGVKKSESRSSAWSEPASEHYSGYVPCNIGFCKQFRKLKVGEVQISVSTGDNCITAGNDIVLVRNILVNESETLLVCQKFCKREDFYTYPLRSSMLGIYLVSQLSEDVHVKKLSDYSTKNVLLPLKDSYVIIPMPNN